MSPVWPLRGNEVDHAEYIERGYEHIDLDLQELGAGIELIK